MCSRHNAIIGINGDYYAGREGGIIVRNYVLYRNVTHKSVGCLYYDGTFDQYTYDTFDLDSAMAKGLYQTMTFGPILVQGGQVLTNWTSSVSTTPNPRSSFGYYEPGHYVMVVVDGRQEGYSDGLTGSELAEFMGTLGVTEAFNLDGGDSSVLYFNGQVYNRQSGVRKLSDMFIISEVG